MLSGLLSISWDILTLDNHTEMFHKASMVNEKPSWKSNIHGIWSKNQFWLLGPLEFHGTLYALIYSPFGNRCPFNLESGFWLYHHFTNGWTVAATNEINIKCLKGWFLIKFIIHIDYFFHFHPFFDTSRDFHFCK